MTNGMVICACGESGTLAASACAASLSARRGPIRRSAPWTSRPHASPFQEGSKAQDRLNQALLARKRSKPKSRRKPSRRTTCGPKIILVKIYKAPHAIRKAEQNPASDVRVAARAATINQGRRPKEQRRRIQGDSHDSDAWHARVSRQDFRRDRLGGNGERRARGARAQWKQDTGGGAALQALIEQAKKEPNAVNGSMTRVLLASPPLLKKANQMFNERFGLNKTFNIVEGTDNTFTTG